MRRHGRVPAASPGKSPPSPTRCRRQPHKRRPSPSCRSKIPQSVLPRFLPSAGVLDLRGYGVCLAPSVCQHTAAACDTRPTAAAARRIMAPGALRHVIPQTHSAHPRAPALQQPRRAHPPRGHRRHAYLLQRARRGDPRPALRGIGRDGRRHLERAICPRRRGPQAHRAGRPAADAGDLRAQALLANGVDAMRPPRMVAREHHRVSAHRRRTPVPGRADDLLGSLTMRVTLWGTRGSLATPDPDMARYGGNTSCVGVLGREGTMLVLDAGTGIRRLAATIPSTAHRVDILLTHLHMDHIQGLGFFAHLYRPDFEVHIWGPGSATLGLEARLMRYLSPPLFPVNLSELPCKLEFHQVPSGEVDIGEFRVCSALVCHPGPTVGYRISTDKSALVYLPDHEPALAALRFPSLPREWTSGGTRAADADLLIHDSQYR